jgi:hypothetical protein
MAKTQIKWTEKLVEILLSIILKIGAHVANKNEVTTKWNEVNDEFFNHEEVIALKDVHYSKNNHRKLKDKFNQVMSVAMKDLDAGQRVKYNDTNIYKIAKSIHSEKEDSNNHHKNAASETKFDDIKAKLDEFEQHVHDHEMEFSNHKRIRINDGDIITMTAHDGHESHNDQKRLRRSINDNHQHDKQHKAEEIIEKEFFKLLKNQSKLNLDSFLTECELDKTEENDSDKKNDVLILRRLGLQSLISIYCTNGHNFSSKYFKDEMLDLGLTKMTSHKLYSILQYWRMIELESPQNEMV